MTNPGVTTMVWGVGADEKPTDNDTKEEEEDDDDDAFLHSALGKARQLRWLHKLASSANGNDDNKAKSAGMDKPATSLKETRARQWWFRCSAK